MDALQLLAKGTVVLFVVSSMLSIGLAARWTEIIAPMRRPSWILRALVANFVLAPVVALAVVSVLPLEPGYEQGLLLLAFAAGVPLLPKLAEAGRADVASATPLMVILMAVSVVAMPLALPLLVKGMHVNPWRIAAPLVILMLAPLVLGMVWRRFAPQTGATLLPAVTRTSNIGFVAAVVLICGTNFAALAGVLGSGAMGTAVLFVVLLFAVGWAVGEPNPPARRLLGFASGARNTGVVGLLLLLAATAWVRRRDQVRFADGSRT
jgi:predicted Na+-dependent transporter